ncbi:hypothetical protein FXO38_11023 [Capsicum annuum]|nr:hypothetical protein FXO38_11023 [Capsicum annuum]
MASSDKYDVGNWDFYPDDPCPIYKGPHFRKDCNYTPNWEYRSYDEKKEEQQTKPIGLGAILQTILDQVNVKARELGKNIILENLTTLPISQKEDNKEGKLSYDDDLGSDDSLAEARLWLNIICSSVSQCTHMTIVRDTQARMVFCLLLGIALSITEICDLKVAVLYEPWRDLRDAYDKIAKRENKRYKFFKKLWKRVKGIFKVLKPNHPVPLPRLDSEDEAPAEWPADDTGGDEAE